MNRPILISAFCFLLSALCALGQAFTFEDLSRPTGPAAPGFVLPPVASFAGTPLSGPAPLSVVFTNSTSGATNYAWVFGDGNTSALPNPTNSYAAGTYSVALTAIGAGGTNALTLTNYVTALVVNAAHSAISPATASIAANGVSVQAITVQARDSANENMLVGGETVVFSKTGGGSLSSTIDHGDGTYTTGLTSAVTNGTATVTATLGGTSVGTAVSASSSVVTFAAASMSPTYSTVTASPTNNVTADGSAYSTITITVKDTDNLAMPGKGVVLSKTGAGLLTTPAATDSAGQTTARLTSATANMKTISATVTNQSGTPVSITQQAYVWFVAGTPNAYSSTASANPTTGVTANGSAYSTITVTLLDGNYNVCTGLTITNTVSGGTGNTLSTPATTDANGVTTFTLSSTSTGTKTVTIHAGAVTLNTHPTVTFN